MMDRVCQLASSLLCGLLNSSVRIENDSVCDPTIFYSTIYRVQASILKVATTYQLSQTFGEQQARVLAESMFRDTFDDPSRTESADELHALNNFETWLNRTRPEPFDVADLYEMMLAVEYQVHDGRIELDGEEPGSIGCFFTPERVADKLVSLTLDSHIFHQLGIRQFSRSEEDPLKHKEVKHLLLSSTFADHACGTGNLLLAIVRYCQRHLHISPDEQQQLVLQFHATEADRTALELSKVRLAASAGDLRLYEEVGKRFVHGNPLIEPDTEYPAFSYFHEHFYHNGLALSAIDLPVCDVVLGNPPWGNVEFDLLHYLYLLSPGSAKVKNESELHKAMEELSRTHPELYAWFMIHDEAIDLAIENMYNDDRFAHSTMGGLHTNVLFTELNDSLCTPQGSIGLVLKTSTLNDPLHLRLRKHLTARNRIRAQYDLINSEKLFNIPTDEQFSMLILGEHAPGTHVHRQGLTELSQI